MTGKRLRLRRERAKVIQRLHGMLAGFLSFAIEQRSQNRLNPSPGSRGLLDGRMFQKSKKRLACSLVITGLQRTAGFTVFSGNLLGLAVVWCRRISLRW